MDLPAEHILDHYRHPRHKGAINDPTVTQEESNWSCGDTLTVQIRMEGDHIADIGWSGEGCAISQAAMSLLAEALQDKTLTEADALTSQDILHLLAIPIGARRFKCALLCLHTWKNAIRTYRTLPPLPWNETVGNADQTR